jgi:hypothetical protein
MLFFIISFTFRDTRTHLWVSAEALTTGRMIPSGTNSPPAKVLPTLTLSRYRSHYSFTSVIETISRIVHKIVIIKIKSLIITHILNQYKQFNHFFPFGFRFCMYQRLSVSITDVKL